MRTIVKWLGLGIALAVLILSVTNASWLAADPKGAPKIIAHRGISQDFDRAGVTRHTCTATRIEEPFHTYLENTRAGILRADKMGAWYVEVDVAPTADGEVVLFHDWTLDCRTDGSGPVRDATLAELQALDIGYGYTADGGATYPLRGTGIGKMPTLEEVVRALPIHAKLMINFKSDDPAEANLVADILARAGRDPEAKGDAFYGAPTVTARVRELYPESWAWSPAEARQCSQDYVTYGWSGYLPESCRGKTMVIPLNAQWMFWGWPNRLIARMEAYGGEIIVTGPYERGEPNTGLTLPEQFTEIPDSFNGYVWVEDTFNLAPALHSSADDRNQAEIDAGQAALERRREDQ
ncbi:glycerophosphodiester phosphodiesterase family protein [uncultured Erythrobacter sp.]|uniref:glycerophosphodiester phosphodiesterase family protein n=1 Tax=uncultured Erythrobacter sp. TaxID=263913 RepID=UPI002637A671|nr:glycerophosphodiester phosphodiesterase family protein [uncultured Erythrobacter sp.]